MPETLDPVIQRWQEAGRQILEIRNQLQAEINAAGFGPSRPEVLEGPVSLAPPWKAAAKKYRRLASELDGALAGSVQHYEQAIVERNAGRVRIAALEAAIWKLRADLWQFGDHQRSCARVKNSGDACTCGYQQALSRGEGPWPGD